MEDFTQWLSNLPVYFGRMFSWLVTDIRIGDFAFTPLGALGVSLGAFLAVLVALKIKNLII